MPNSTLIGTFRVETEIGRGGMGVVYRARDERLDRVVALKAIAPALACDTSRMSRFRQEARTIAQLNHPHIAQIHHFLEHDGNTYLVLEYVPGRSLAERIERSGPIEPREALRLCVQIARGLEAAHARGIIHRDLKPENVCVTDDGTAKVLDFGIALVSTAATPADGATRIGPTQAVEAGMGTPGYMSPEQARGDSVDGRADIFSFGCVLFECLTGHNAFEGRTTADLIAATLRGDPNYGILPPDLPEGLGALLRQCLAREVESRVQTMREVRERLEECVGARRATPEPRPGADDPPNNLPRTFDRFIGRVAALTEIDSLLDQRLLVTLTGAGGCGKTRLAIEAARRVMPRFPDGVWIAELAPVGDAAMVPNAVGNAMGFKPPAGRSISQALAEHIGTKRVLLVLDNCEHMLEAACEMTQELLDACVNLRILATSREALGVRAEQSWRVPSLGVPAETRSEVRSKPVTRGGGSLTPPGNSPTSPAALMECESVSLFVDRATAAKPAFALTAENSASIANICRRLDGVPLAIELAAARVKVLAPEQIERHLDDRFKLLRAGRGRAERHQTLRAAIDWSYQMLGHEEQRALRRLSVFAGGCTLEAATAVIAGPDADMFEVLDLLTHLGDKSMLVTDEQGGEARYRLLETMRQYAIEALAQAGEVIDARHAHLRYFHSLAQAAYVPMAGSEQRLWFERLDRDFDNIIEAMSWASVDATAEGDGTPLDLGLCIGGRLHLFWEARGHHGVARRMIAALTKSKGVASPASRASALHAAAQCAMRQGDLDDSRALGEEALVLWHECGDRRGEAGSLNQVAVVETISRRFDQAEVLYRKALSINREIGNKDWEAYNLGNLGYTASERGDLDEAKRLYEQAIAVHREVGAARFIASMLGNLADLARRRNDVVECRRLRAEAIDLYAPLADRQGLLEQLGQASILAAVSDEPEAAARLAGAAEAIREAIGVTHMPDTQRELEQNLPASKEALRGRTGSDAAWASAYLEGKGMPQHDAIEFSLGWLRGSAQRLAR
ncbi:MAG: protein kinase domain-containing protein [Phycisphaerales bacterium]